MVDKEMLSAISDLLDEKLEEKLEEKLQPIHERLDRVEATVEYVKVEQLENGVIPRLDKLESDMEDGVIPRLDKLESDMEDGVIPRLDKLEEKTEHLKEELIYIKVTQLENGALKLLNDIESQYLDTYKIYRERTEQIDGMALDIDVMKSTIKNHSNRLNKIMA